MYPSRAASRSGSAFPEVWLYVLGGMFVLVTLFLPQGLVGIRFGRRWLRQRDGDASAALAPTPPVRGESTGSEVK